jgi:hypothetical protein
MEFFEPVNGRFKQMFPRRTVIDVDFGQVFDAEERFIIVGPVYPVIPGVVFAVLIGQGGLEGFMAAAPVVGDEIKQDADAEMVGFVDQFADVFGRSQAGIDGEVVGGVVAVVGVVGEEGVDPEAVEAQVGDVIEVLDDAAKIAAEDVVKVV